MWFTFYTPFTHHAWHHFAFELQCLRAVKLNNNTHVDTEIQWYLNVNRYEAYANCLFVKIISYLFSFCRAMPASSAALAVMRCLSVCLCVCLFITFVHSVKTNKHIFEIFSPSGSHSSFSTPNGMATFWRDSPPYGGVECKWGRQKSRFWTNISLHCVLWNVPAASAIHLPASNHGEFITLAGKRPSLLMVGNNDEVEASTYVHRRQRYAVVNLTPK